MKETVDQQPIEEINTDDPHRTKLWAMKQIIDEIEDGRGHYK